MKVLAKLKSGPYLSSRGGHGWMTGNGPGGFVVDKVERYGASYAFGFLKGYYRDRASWRGIGVDALVGGASLLVATGLNMMSHGHSKLAPHLERIGDSGLQSYLNSIGASNGATAAGRAVMVLDQAKPAVRGFDILGMIPQAMGGSYLRPEDIANFASRR